MARRLVEEGGVHYEPARHRRPAGPVGGAGRQDGTSQGESSHVIGRDYAKTVLDGRDHLYL